MNYMEVGISYRLDRIANGRYSSLFPRGRRQVVAVTAVLQSRLDKAESGLDARLSPE